MKKLLVVFVLMSWAFHMFGAVQTYEVKFDDVELAFENIVLEDVDFCKGNEIIIETKDQVKILVSQNGQKLTISTNEETKISLELPISKRYQYVRDDGICKFDCETLNFDGDDVFVIISSAGLKVKEYNNGTEVVISDEGIYVRDNGEIININENGVTIEGSNDDIKLKGLVGVLASAIARGTVNAALSSIGKTPDKVFKFVVNDEDNESIHFGWN